MNTQIAKLFEELASATWDRIQVGEELQCSQGEETITDLNLLELKRADLRNLHIRKVTKAEESKSGIDWEWWIGSNSRGWWRYAVQAKKLNQDRRYSALRHKIGHHYQIDILEEFARLNRCIPLYCFYNFTEEDTRSYWHCSLPYEPTQFGCTIAPLDVVRNVFARNKPKSFGAVHGHAAVFPWRCLVKCPELLPTPQSGGHFLATGAFSQITPYPVLPPFLRNQQREVLVRELPNDYYNPNIIVNNSQVYPRRIVVVDVER